MNDLTISTVVDQIIDLLSPFWQCINLSEGYTETARRLSIIAAKSPPWTWRYVQGLHAGTIKASPRIDLAARVLLDRLTGADPVPIQSQSETVQVHAQTGTITPGAWVLAPSRPCADPSCKIYFIPRVPWQRYCPLHTRR